MKTMCKCLCMAIIWLALFTSHSSAEDIYVTGVTKITMRTNAGVEHKIVAMLKSGTKLQIVEYRKDWTHVKTSYGKKGWVLSRFLTQKVPDALLVDNLKRNNEDLILKLASVEDENRGLAVKNVALIQTEEKYNKLKQESSDFLKLDAKNKELEKQYEIQKTYIEKLENSLNNDPKLWFLIGPGVFIVGIFFGLSTRKKKRSGLL